MANDDSNQKPQLVPDVSERRRTVRYQCDGHALINTIPNLGMQQKGSLRDLSLGGCNVEFAAPYPPATRLELMLHVNNLSLRVSGIVRNRCSNGMGVEFDIMSSAGRNCLRELVSEFRLSNKESS